MFLRIALTYNCTLLPSRFSTLQLDTWYCHRPGRTLPCLDSQLGPYSWHTTHYPCSSPIFLWIPWATHLLYGFASCCSQMFLLEHTSIILRFQRTCLDR